MRKYKIEKITAWVIIFLGIIAIYFIFIFFDIVPKTDQKITFIIASFGALFSIIQFWISSISRRMDFIKRIQYEEYLRVRELIQIFFNHLSENMVQVRDIHSLVRQLNNTRNELSVIINSNNKSILSGVTKNQSVINFGEKLNEVIIKTDKFRLESDRFEKAKNSSKGKPDWSIKIEEMNWRNDILKDVKTLHELKYDLLFAIEKKII